MRSSLTLTLATICIQWVSGHPGSTPRQSTPTPFDAKSQLISVDGFHEFRPPGRNDVRGPCPGLNALSNHGYLPRSGYISIFDAIAASRKVYGMGEDLATILSVYAGAIDGAVVSWSIGGGFHVGLGGSHNNYETDSSPLRGDLYQYGSNTDLVMAQFKKLYDLQPDPATANYNIDVLAQFRKIRMEDSIQMNPHFFYGPFSGTVVSQAAFSFIYRFMGNKSAEHPDGLLNKDVLKSFMGISGPEDDLKWTPGHERIPENWYTRNNADLYSLTSSIGRDISTLQRADPRIGSPGCNTGTINSFVPINFSDLTAGAYPEDEALTNPVCFGVAFAIATIVNKIPIVNTVVQELLLPIQNLLGCNTIPSLNMSVLEACPGYSFYGGPTADIIGGALQET